MNITLDKQKLPEQVRNKVINIELPEEVKLHQEEKILLAIYQQGTIVSSELVQALDMSSSSMSRSLNYLDKKGLIIEAGIRKSKISGKTNTIWSLTGDGKKIIAKRMIGIQL